MEQSQSIKELAAALCKAQGELTAVPRTKQNPFYKSNYADLAEVIAHVKPILKKHGLAVAQVCDGEGGVCTTLMHESGEWMRGTLTLRPVKDDPQGRGSAITYARRYAYAAIVGVASEEDDDGNGATQGNGHDEAKPKNGKRKEAPKVSLSERSDVVIAHIDTLTTQEEVKAQMEVVKQDHATGAYTDAEYNAIRQHGINKFNQLKGK